MTLRMSLKRSLNLVLLLVFYASLLTGQNNTASSTGESKVQIIGKDTFFVDNITPVYIYSQRIFTEKEKEEYQKYLRLVRNIKRVYPYSKIAAQLFKEVNDSLQKIPSKTAREQYVAQMEKDLMAKYEDELKKLTITQGKILIKLFYRETGTTTYSVVKDLRGSFEAFFWQTLARFFGSNLKMKYDPAGEDKEIEQIVQMIERGEL
jgi:hypothetical protein